MASCGCAAQQGLWPPVALQPSEGYGLLWLCCPARAMASCGSAAQRGLWPSVALLPSKGYGLLWLCSPERAMASKSHEVSWSYTTRHSRTSDQLVAGTSTWQHTTDKYSCPRWNLNPRLQQASGRRPTTQTARPLGPVQKTHCLKKLIR
jgi:hypothetical protein